MNEFFPLASAAGMTVGLAVCALIIGLVLAMLFAVLEGEALKERNVTLDFELKVRQSTR